MGAIDATGDALRPGAVRTSAPRASVATMAETAASRIRVITLP